MAIFFTSSLERAFDLPTAAATFDDGIQLELLASESAAISVDDLEGASPEEAASVLTGLMEALKYEYARRSLRRLGKLRYLKELLAESVRLRATNRELAAQIGVAMQLSLLARRENERLRVESAALRRRVSSPPPPPPAASAAVLAVAEV